MDLARKEYFPDARVSVGYGFRETLASPVNLKQADMFTGSVMFNVPIWVGSKIKPKIREEQAKQGAAKDAHQSALDQLAAAIKDRHAKLQRLAKQISLLTRGSSLRPGRRWGRPWPLYQVGALPFNQLYQNQIAVYNAEMQLEEYLRGLRRKLG